MRALNGIRVLDLSRYAPGRYCTVALADLGAEVTTIEDPNLAEGETAEFFCSDTTGRYMIMNRGKKSIALNLKMEEGRRIFYQLVKEADVVVETFRPGVVRRLKVDYETVSEMKPSIVYCSITGYGQDGPWALRPGHDMNYVAAGGILHSNGEPGKPPAVLSTQVGDIGGGSFMGVIGILTALFAREHTGRGQYVDVAMLDGVLSYLWFMGGRYYLEGKPFRRGEEWILGTQPRYHVYETKDGKYLAVGCFEPWFWRNLCKAVGREEFADDVELSRDRAKEVIAAFEDIFRSKTRDEWISILGEADTCVSPVYDVGEALSNPQSLHRGTIQEVAHPKSGNIKQVVFPIKFSELKPPAAVLAPTFAEHTREIMINLGYTEKEVEDLRKRKVVSYGVQVRTDTASQIGSGTGR